MNEHRKEKCQFASDNCAPICPQALEAIVEANAVCCKSYGEDHWTQQASDLLRALFETDCEVFFVFSGTAANALSLSSLCRSYHSIICHEQAHIETDECGAPEFFSNGTKLLTVPGANGKIDLDAARMRITRRHDIHYPRPRALSVTQATETGTVYTGAQLREIGEMVKEYGVHFHMDGARFANAVASLECAPAEISWKAGVDVLCFGGTKNGMAIGEAVVFFNHELAREFEYHCKQGGQLGSKMRFISAPWIRMIGDSTWLDNARHANRMARQLLAMFSRYPMIRIAYPCEANSVFVRMGDSLANGLRDKGWLFHNFIGTGDYRFMCSWATSEADIAELEHDLRQSAA